MVFCRIVFCFVFVLQAGGDLASAAETPANGALLYEQHCAACHRPLARSLLLDRPARRIRSAITTLSVMNHLKTLSDDQLQEIANALSGPPR